MGAVIRQRLESMIEHATVDGRNEAEQVTGFFRLIEENLAAPFGTQVLGVDVTVDEVDMTEDDQIVAICTRGRSRQVLPILQVPLPDPSAVGGSGSVRTGSGRQEPGPSRDRAA